MTSFTKRTPKEEVRNSNFHRRYFMYKNARNAHKLNITEGNSGVKGSSLKSSIMTKYYFE